MTRKLAVVGSPVAHSLSPKIHRAAYKALRIDWDYSAIEVPAGGLQPWLMSLDQDWLGVSVTAPLKEEAAAFAATDFERILGSANTLVRTASGWSGYNTDVFGMIKALHGVNNVNSVSLIGAGATAKSALAAISLLYPNAKLKIYARSRDAASKLSNFALHAFKTETAISVDIEQGLTSSDLVISTLPAHALDDTVQRLAKRWFKRPRGVLFDVSYNPWPSAAARLFEQEGLLVISGLEMLLWQAIAQIRVFSGGDLDQELFNEAAVMLAMRDAVGLL